jgi:hypothetical protein
LLDESLVKILIRKGLAKQIKTNNGLLHWQKSAKDVITRYIQRKSFVTAAEQNAATFLVKTKFITVKKFVKNAKIRINQKLKDKCSLLEWSQAIKDRFQSRNLRKNLSNVPNVNKGQNSRLAMEANQNVRFARQS